MNARAGLYTDGVQDVTEVENYIENHQKKITMRLQQRLDYENSSEFYHCRNEDLCNSLQHENALDGMFKYPSCVMVLNLK